jgi:hypothetical protein
MQSPRFRSIDRVAQLSGAADATAVPTEDEQREALDSVRAPRSGLILMIIIVAGLALIALYANVQKARRDKIEQVTIIPASTAAPTSSSPGH